MCSFKTLEEIWKKKWQLCCNEIKFTFNFNLNTRFTLAGIYYNNL